MLSRALTTKTDVAAIVSAVANDRTDSRNVSACANIQTESTSVVSACDNSPTDCRVVSEVANNLSWLQNRVRHNTATTALECDVATGKWTVLHVNRCEHLRGAERSGAEMLAVVS